MQSNSNRATSPSCWHFSTTTTTATSTSTSTFTSTYTSTSTTTFTSTSTSTSTFTSTSSYPTINLIPHLSSLLEILPTQHTIHYSQFTVQYDRQPNTNTRWSIRLCYSHLWLCGRRYSKALWWDMNLYENFDASIIFQFNVLNSFFNFLFLLHLFTTLILSTYLFWISFQFASFLLNI